MTYTEQDLRAVFGALESDAPDAAGTLAGLDRLRRRRTVRRRTVGMAAVAAVTMALAAGSLTVPEFFGDDDPVAPAADAWQVRFAVDLPGVRPSSTIVQAGRQSVDFGTEAGWMTVTVFDQGGFDPARPRPGRSVDVNGRTGFYRDDLDVPVDRPEVWNPPPRPGLAWEYAPDSWATVTGVQPDPVRPRDMAADLLPVARAVRFGHATPFRMPFTIGYLPGGLRPDRLLHLTAQPSGEPDTILTFVTVELSADDGRSLTIEASTRTPNLPVGEPVVDRGNVAINLGPFMIWLYTAESADRNVPVPELVKTAESIAMAGDWNDPATWIEAARAIPTG